MKFIISFIFIFISCPLVYSQSIENVNFTVNEDFITVNYDLKHDATNFYFDLELVFVKSNGENIFPINIKGDIYKVIPGISKQIIWYYKNEISDYEGGIKAVVKIKNSTSFNDISNSKLVKPIIDTTTSKPEESISIIQTSSNPTQNINKRGPGNALLSAILPGFGGFVVNNKEKVTPLLIAGMFWASAYMSYDAYNKSNEFYANYLSTRSQSEMDLNFASATENKQKHETYLTAAAGIWLFDVIQTIIKGNKNIKTNNLISKNSITIIPKIKPGIYSNPLQLSIVKTF